MAPKRAKVSKTTKSDKHVQIFDRLAEMGHENIVLFGLGDTAVTARIPAHVRLCTRESARISFRPSRLHAFDRATGARLMGGGA